MFPGLPDAQGQVRFMVEWVLVLFISCRGNPAKRLLTLSADKGRRGAASSCRKPPFFKASGILICLLILPRSRGRCQRREQNGGAIRAKNREKLLFHNQNTGQSLLAKLRADGACLCR